MLKKRVKSIELFTNGVKTKINLTFQTRSNNKGDSTLSLSLSWYITYVRKQHISYNSRVPHRTLFGIFSYTFRFIFFLLCFFFS